MHKIKDPIRYSLPQTMSFLDGDYVSVNIGFIQAINNQKHERHGWKDNKRKIWSNGFDLIYVSESTTSKTFSQ